MEPLRAPRRWTLVAAAAVVLALGVGGRVATRPLAFQPRGSTSHVVSSGSLDAVLRTEADRIEPSVAAKLTSTRLMLLLAVGMAGLVLLLLRGGPRARLAASGPPPLARLRRLVGLRAPPARVALVP